MSSLHLYSTLKSQLRKWLPEERITRLRNLAWLMTGLFLARSVHLSHIARKLPLPGRIDSLTNRLRRFLDNPRVDVWSYYRPVAKQLLALFRGQRLILLITDGKPMDSGYDASTGYAQYDVRMACQENLRQGLHTFCISTDDNSPADLELMFPHHRHVILSDVTMLPQLLPRLYLRLTL